MGSLVALWFGGRKFKEYFRDDPLVTNLRTSFFDLSELGIDDEGVGVRVFDQNDNMLAEFADFPTVEVAKSIIRPLLPSRVSAVREAFNDYADVLISLQEED